MRWFSRAGGLVLAVLLLPAAAAAYKPLSDHFLRLVPAADLAADLDPRAGRLLAPLLQPRPPGSPGHAAAQQHLVGFFADVLPDWTVEWQNVTTYAAAGTSPGRGRTRPRPRPRRFEHLVFRREPPWTRPGQANLLTLAAHYATPAGVVGAADAAASCALLLHVARSLDAWAAQMYREMQELGEGGTVPMDMGLQVVFLDGHPDDPEDAGNAPSGSAQLAAAWERATNPALPASRYGYPNRLDQISLLLLLDLLGPPSPRVPSRYLTTHWAYRAMARVESRLRGLHLLEANTTAAGEASGPFLPDRQVPAHQAGLAAGWATDRDDHLPFMRRGVAVLPVVPDAAPPGTKDSLDLPTLRDWSRILTGFVLEWLDMMEVEPPQEAQATQTRRRRRRRP